jgi:ABC-type multidrug transport system fused ATPase/permease subunit
MVTLLAIKAFLKFWGIKGLAFLHTVPYKKHILVGLVVLLVFVGLVRYCSKPKTPDYTIQSGTEEVQKNEEKRREDLNQTLQEIQEIRRKEAEKIKELERIVEDLKRSRPSNVTADDLERKAGGR